MSIRKKNISFFLALVIILLFFTGCSRFGTKNTEAPATLPSSTASADEKASAGENDASISEDETSSGRVKDPFRQTLPIEKSPDYFVTKDYQDRVPEEGVQTLISSERMKILPPSVVAKQLGIKPGMDILDIGAGTGTFTFPMADELKNTGHVYATEVEPRLIKEMEEHIAKFKYKNVTPVHVSREGVDPFYKQHQFDVILVCETIPCMRDITSYFSELRPSLKKGGHLYIINFRNVSDFNEIDFGRFRKVSVFLHGRGDKFPIFKRLDKEVQNYIRDLPEGNNPNGIASPPPEIKARIVKNFNQMLSDRFLINDLVDYFDSMGYYKQDKDAFPPELEWPRPFVLVIHPAELGLFKWLYVHLDDEGVFDKDNKALTAGQKEELQKLNKIILTGIFHLYTTSIVKGEFQPAVFLEKRSIVSKMKKAGYKLTNDYNTLPQYFFLEFERL